MVPMQKDISCEYLFYLFIYFIECLVWQNITGFPIKLQLMIPFKMHQSPPKGLLLKNPVECKCFFPFFLRPWLVAPLICSLSVFSVPLESLELTLRWVVPRGLGFPSAMVAHMLPSLQSKTTWSGWCPAEWWESQGEKQLVQFLKRLFLFRD